MLPLATGIKGQAINLYHYHHPVEFTKFRLSRLYCIIVNNLGRGNNGAVEM